jgi:hypothetical protein
VDTLNAPPPAPADNPKSLVSLTMPIHDAIRLDDDLANLGITSLGYNPA